MSDPSDEFSGPSGLEFDIRGETYRAHSSSEALAAYFEDRGVEALARSKEVLVNTDLPLSEHVKVTLLDDIVPDNHKPTPVKIREEKGHPEFG